SRSVQLQLLQLHTRHGHVHRSLPRLSPALQGNIPGARPDTPARQLQGHTCQSEDCHNSNRNLNRMFLAAIGHPTFSDNSWIATDREVHMGFCILRSPVNRSVCGVLSENCEMWKMRQRG